MAYRRLSIARTLFCLILTLSAFYTFGNTEYERIDRKIEEIKPIPTLKVISIEEGFLSSFSRPDVEIFEVESPLTTSVAPAIGMQFSINDLDESISKMESSYAAAALVNGEEDPNFLPYMIKLGKGNASAKAKKVKEIVGKAIDVAKEIDLLTGGDLVSMPLIKKEMIGQTEVSIVFNKAKIYPTHTLLEVYIKIAMAQEDVYGDPVELFFAADNILFSQEEGIIGGTIGLVNDYAIKVGGSEKTAIWLKKMTKTAPAGVTDLDEDDPFDDNKFVKSGTYVSFNCDGFQALSIEGEILFSRNWVIPADEFGVPLQGDQNNPTPRVKATILASVENMNDLFFGLDMPNFLLTNYQDIGLNIGGAFVDLSSYRNPPTLPDFYNAIPNIWEGVYIENIGITLPDPFKRSCSSYTTNTPAPDSPTPPERCRIKIDAKHLIIDEYGVDGNFSIAGQAPLLGGPIMDGEWGWSLNQLGITVDNSELTGFDFSGGIGVPILDKDDPLYYTASINLGDKKQFDFFLAPTGNTEKSFPVWNAAKVTLSPPTIDISVSEGEFDATVKFSGSLQIGNPKDKKTTEGGSVLKMPAIEFTDLTFSTRDPIVQINGFNLVEGSEESRIANFPIVPENLGLSSPPNSKLLHIDFGLKLNLMKTDESAISANGSVKVIGELVRDLNGARHWEYKDLVFTGAQVKVDVSQFYGVGTLNLFKGDKIYGNGFSAKLTAKIIGSDLSNPQNKGKFGLKMAAIFGSSPSSSNGEVETEDGDPDNYRYWLVDGLMQSDDLAVPLVPPFEINGFGGGAFYHMRPFSYNENSTEESSAMAELGESTTGVVYRPNASTGLGLKFTTSITTKGNLMSGLLTAIIRFSPGGGLQNITFWGTVDILKKGKVNKRLKLKIEDRLPSMAKPTDQVISEDVLSAQEAIPFEVIEEQADGLAGEDKGIKGQIGISFDFDGGFTFHGFAKVTIKTPNDVISGVGTLDILLDLSDDEGEGASASEKGDWHFYLGGYYDNPTQQVMVPGFFNESELVKLEPISLMVGYDHANVEAQAYFLTGTTIPGPPPAPAEVIEFFSEDPEVNEDNRDGLNCGDKGVAMGTGIAFGAFAKFEMDKKIGGPWGACPFGIEVKVLAIVGFDLSLLKYDPDQTCSLSDSPPPMGLEGFRATGRAYAIVDLRGGHITCFPLPQVGVGLKVEFDVFKPSYLDIKATVKAFGEKATVGFSIGDQCGVVCN